MTEAVQPLPPPSKQHDMVKVSPRWGRLIRRLMALSDGQHQIIIQVNDGQIDTWSLLIPHKVEK